MTPGPTIIKKCSVCSKPIKQHTIGSGNTFGATFWTDGKREAPMLPDQPWLIMCPHCQAALWIDEQEEIGEIEAWGFVSDDFKDARVYEIPLIEDYFALLAHGVDDPEKESYVRLRAWWAGNDKRRTDTQEIPMSSREVKNLAAFAQTLNELDANDLVMKAEAMRELGRFDDACLLLAKSVDKDMEQAVVIIRNLSENHDQWVRKIHF
jgi:hypothetical protein